MRMILSTHRYHRYIGHVRNVFWWTKKKYGLKKTIGLCLTNWDAIVLVKESLIYSYSPPLKSKQKNVWKACTDQAAWKNISVSHNEEILLIRSMLQRSSKLQWPRPLKVSLGVRFLEVVFAINAESFDVMHSICKLQPLSPPFWDKRKPTIPCSSIQTSFNFWIDELKLNTGYCYFLAPKKGASLPYKISLFSCWNLAMQMRLLWCHSDNCNTLCGQGKD